MKIYREGEKSKAICSHCKGKVDTTFKTRDVPFSDGKGIAKSVLVSVCDTCDKVAAVPQQSAPRIKEQLEKERRPVEATVPKHMADILLNSLLVIGLEGRSEYYPKLFNYYVLELESKNSKTLKRLLNSFLDSERNKGKASERISLKMKNPILPKFESIVVGTGLKKTEVLRSIILMMEEELLNKKEKTKIKKLREVMQIAS